MAPNFSGTLFETHEEMIELNKCCLTLSLTHGAKDCFLIMKTLDGEQQKSLAWILNFFYADVTRYKPRSSRS